MNKAGLLPLIYPSTAEDFFTRWPKKPFVVHGLDKSIEPLTQLTFLKSLDALLNSWPNLIQVHLPDARDESSAIDASPSDARKLFSNHMALLFNNAQNISPVLEHWLDRLARDLGLPMSTHARSMLYATPDGKGTAAHFDQNINFVLQLHGRKTWWIAANSSVENPTERHTLGQTLDPELQSYAHAAMPEQMPEDSTKIELNPGSMLFVPRGYWHRTEAAGEALALNFTFSQPTWVDLFTLALRSRLTLSPDWRELADGVTSSRAELREQATQKFENLLEELIFDLPNWTAGDILASTEGIDSKIILE